MESGAVESLLNVAAGLAPPYALFEGRGAGAGALIGNRIGNDYGRGYYYRDRGYYYGY